MDREVDDVDAGPEADGPASALRAEPELAAHRAEVPGGWNHAVELDRPTLNHRGGAGVDRALDARHWLRLRDGGQAGGQPQWQQLALLVGRGLEALGRGDRRAGLERLVRPLRVVITDP